MPDNISGQTTESEPTLTMDDIDVFMRKMNVKEASFILNNGNIYSYLVDGNEYIFEQENAKSDDMVAESDILGN